MHLQTSCCTARKTRTSTYYESKSAPVLLYQHHILMSIFLQFSHGVKGFAKCPCAVQVSVCVKNEWFINYVHTFAVLACTAFALTLLKIRRARDNFRIKVELVYDLLTGGLLTSLLILHRFIDLEEILAFYVSGIAFDALLLPVYASMFCYPVYLARAKVDNRMSKQLDVTLRDVLDCDDYEVCMRVGT